MDRIGHADRYWMETHPAADLNAQPEVVVGHSDVREGLGGRGPSSWLKWQSILGYGQCTVLKWVRFANTSGTWPVKEHPYTENKQRLLAEPSSGGIGPARPGL